MNPTGSLIWFLLGAGAGLVLAEVLLRLRSRGLARAAGAREAEERKQRTDAEAHAEALHAETATLSALIEGVAEGVWLTDGDGVVLRHNQTLRALLPPDQELLGKRPLAVLRNEALHAAVERACHLGESSEVELTVDQRVLAVHVAPLAPGVPGPSLAVFRDFSELRRLEKVRQEFVANVSHELRTPITAIMGYSETLLAGALDDPAHAPGMVEIIHRQSQRLSRLVGDLLELSHLDAQKVALATAPLRLLPLAQRAAEALAPRLEQKRIAFVSDVPADLLAEAEERALEQVLVNLLDNAVKYTAEGGRISLLGRVDGERVRLSVRDSGVGIPPQHLPRLFERFYRVDPGRSRDLGGTGLGLSIVKHLVLAMGGALEVDSQPGEGSEFSVLLLSASPKVDPAG